MAAVAKSSLKVTKSAVKSAKSSLKVHTQEKTPPTDRERVQEIANLLLGRLEITIRSRVPKKPKKVVPKKSNSKKTADPKPEEDNTNSTAKNIATSKEEKFESLFGKKTPVEALIMLSDLLMKLEKPQTTETQGELPTSEELTMNDADLALVEHFVDRVRGLE